MVQLCGHGKECCNASYKSKPNSRYKKCGGEKCGKPGCVGCKQEAIHLTSAARACPLCGRKICSEGCITKCPHKNMAMQGDPTLVEGQLAAAIAGAAAAAGQSGFGIPMPTPPVHHGSQQSMLYQALHRIAGIENTQQVLLSRLNALDTSINVLTQTISITFALQAGQPGNQAQAQALSQLLANQLIAQQQQQQQAPARANHHQDLLQQQQQHASGEAVLADMLQQHHMQQQAAAAAAGRRAPRDQREGPPAMDLSDMAEHQHGLMTAGEHEAAVSVAVAAAAAAAAAAAGGQEGMDMAEMGEEEQQAMMDQAMMQASVEHAMQTLVGGVKADGDMQQHQQQELAQQQQMGAMEPEQGVAGQPILLSILPLHDASREQQQLQEQQLQAAADAGQQAAEQQ